MFTLGVEEEYLLVDGHTGDLRQANRPVLDEARRHLGEQIQPEFLQSQVEVATPVCGSLAETRDQLLRLRASAADAASSEGCRLTAAATHPTARWAAQEVTDKERYQTLEHRMGQVARETLICGMHVHVGIPKRADRIRVLDRIRPWLPVLLALSASSPYWEGRDTGLDSFRTPTFRRWPQTGMPQPFADWAEYEDLVAALVDAGAISDGTNLYWDLRPSWRFDTVEVRIADMCTTVDEAVMLAGLTRALVWRILARDQAPAPARTPRTEVLEAAVRRAARYGLSEQLLHPINASLAPAGQVVDALIAHCAPGLDALGDGDLVAAGIDRIRTEGNSATRQRAAYARRGRWEDVIDALADETVAAL